jgi:hypothetical protein
MQGAIGHDDWYVDVVLTDWKAEFRMPGLFVVGV